MITIRKSKDRGYADHEWLRTYHTFSFASYFDPQHTTYRALRVINEDWIQAGKGFGTHPHENMEILTYVIHGQLEHKDSMGNGSVIHTGELQRMSAGTGVTHSEFNPSGEDTHLIQIWISPERSGLLPEYEQRNILEQKKPNELTLLASQTGRANSLTVHQDMKLYLAQLEQDNILNYTVESERHVWVQIVEGSLEMNGLILHTGDGAAVDDEKTLHFIAEVNTEFLLFDLA
jgi:redox-sensitive bicupin YhaK (pirin superfamily)